MSIEQLHIALENLPLLKCLNLKVTGYCFGLIADRPNIRKFLPKYKFEQLEKVARLVGENYDRFEYLRLGLNQECGKDLIGTECLQKYPNVKIKTQREAIVILKKIVESNA